MTTSASSPWSVSFTSPRTWTMWYGFSWETEESATRPSRSRLRALREPGWVKKAIRSPSIRHQTGTECGAPLGITVATCITFGAVKRRRWESVNSAMAGCSHVMALPDQIRAACARVAAAARHVRIVEDAVPAYARTLPAASPPAPDLAPGAPDEERAAFSLQLNAVNFGSGCFPTLGKRPGVSGFHTVEAGLKARGPWTAEELIRVDAAEAAATFGGQDPEHELMALFAR